MAVTSEFLETWVAASGHPFGFHVSTSRSSRDALVAHGVVPRTSSASTLFRDIRHIAPRNWHFYFTVPHGFWGPWDNFGAFPRNASDWTTLQERTVVINLDALDPALINPDEDAFYDSFLMHTHDMNQLDPQVDDDPNESVADPECHQDLTGRHHRSYGDWAEAVDLGSNPNVTEHAFATVGSLAYNGAIRPSALHPPTLEDLRALYATLPSRDVTLAAPPDYDDAAVEHVGCPDTVRA